MLKEVIQKHAVNCGLSRRLRKKTSIIIEIIEECSSGLSSSKHSQLIEVMKLKIRNPNDLKIQENIILNAYETEKIQWLYENQLVKSSELSENKIKLELIWDDDEQQRFRENFVETVL